MLAIIEPLIDFYTPPTDAEIDQSLANIDNAENAAHRAACAAVHYVHEIEDELLAQGRDWRDMSSDFKELRAAAEKYREMME